MSRRRPATAGSIKPSTVTRPISFKSQSRPGSAKQWFEAYNKRKNEEAVRINGWKETVDHFKKQEFQTFYYNHLDHITNREKDSHRIQAEEKHQKHLNERREKLRKLLDAEKKQYEEERRRLSESNQKKVVTCKSIYPEVEMLQGRLDHLKRQNEEERRKMQETLSYESWKKNSPQIKQMEADRFNHFIQNAWVDQKQWKEDERRREREVIRKAEEEALEKERELERKENQFQFERRKKLDEWKAALDAQVALLRQKEAEQENLILEEQKLQLEREKLDHIISRRLKMQDLRKRKEMELCWARQYQLKLKKKGATIIEELLTDQGITEDLMKHTSPSQNNENKPNEAEWMRNVLEEQKRLEILREKEYDLLFSEEAERMWRKRQTEWEREQKARDKLMSEVIRGLKQQVDEKLNQNNAEKSRIEMERTNCRQAIFDFRQNLTKEQETVEQPKQNELRFSLDAKRSAERLAETQKEEERQLMEHRKEIARLENEMRLLWGPNYMPPNYGRRKVAW